MSSHQYTSSDFHKVSMDMGDPLPDNLVHRDVLGSNSQSPEEAFSAERQHLVRIVNLPSKTMSMTIGGLEPGESSRRHRHNYETLLYVLKGKGKTTIDEVEVYWEQGDAIYIPPWAWHSHLNEGDGRALYLASENAPLLQNLGNIALREEST